MQACPSLLAQTLLLAGEEDETIVCLCELAQKPGLLCSLIKIGLLPHAQSVKDLLPLHLQPVAVACFKSENIEKAKDMAGSLNIPRVYIFDRKAEVFRDTSGGSEIQASKDDGFFDMVFFGVAAESGWTRLSKKRVTRIRTGGRGIGLSAEQLQSNLVVESKRQECERRSQVSRLRC